MHRIAHNVHSPTPAGNRRPYRLGLASLLLLMLGGLLLVPGLRLRTADAASGVLLAQNFDSIPAGSTPEGWRRSAITGKSDFAVSRQEYSSAPQGLRTDGSDIRGIRAIMTPMLYVPSDFDGDIEVSFRHKYNLEKSWTGPCNDGARLLVSLDDPASTRWGEVGRTFGVSFLSGGYTREVNSAANPLYRKSVWCGDSRDWVTTRVRITGVNTSLRLSWEAGFDNSESWGGWTIDDLRITYVKKPVITFTATKSDGTPYVTGQLSPLPVTVTARCTADAPLSQFAVSTSSGYSGNNTTGAAITVPAFTNDGPDQTVFASCRHMGNFGSVQGQFKVSIAQTDLSVAVFGPTQAGTNSQARLTASVHNIGSRTTPAAFDLVTRVPVALGTVTVTAPPEAACTTGAPVAGFRTVTCRIASLAPYGSVYIQMDVQVTGSAGTVARTEASVSPSFPDRPENNRYVLETSITGGRPDLVPEINAFSGIQLNTDNEVEVRLFNRGAVDVSRATARIVLPAGLTYTGTYEPDACTAAGQVLTCTFYLTVRPGESDNITMLVRPVVTAGTVLTIQADADAANAIAESNETNNGATMQVVVGGGPARS
jgi:hypothetical protein